MKTINTRIALAFALVLFIATAVLAALSTGSKAPNFKLKNLDNQAISLSQVQTNPANKSQNRVVLVQFWATWCPYCVEETPHIQALQDKYAKQGFTAVGLSEDSGSSEVKNFLKTHKLTYPILMDDGGSVLKSWSIERGIPQTFLIDRKGVVRYHNVGFDPTMVSTLEKQVKNLLK